ncbi:MAG: DNA polymerase III subunit gamma/tau [Clostridia bacterium]|nr:DNA polymerase III subunit gamma/tau [Clostridia bacterium]
MSYTALYRKYRPKTFEEVVGQEHITKTLRNQIISGRVGHAYLLNGGRGTGKTSSAKILARAINCLNPQNGNPCNECEICKSAINGSLTDIVEMDAASNNSVEDIRSIRDEVNFLPTVAKYRVYIIDEVHMLSIGAFNALLKTLEEPPEHVKFILATTEPQKLPATILSRCQRFDFKKISVEYIKSRINYICEKDNINIEEDAINTISVLAEGAMRDALSILERCLQEGTNKITNEQVKELVGIPKIESVNKIINNILDYNLEETMKCINEVLSDGKDISNLIWEIIKYVKDILVYKTTNKLELYNNSELQQIKILSDKSSKQRLLNIIFYLSDLSNEIKMTTQKSIMFQVGIMKLCNKEENETPKNVNNFNNSDYNTNDTSSNSNNINSSMNNNNNTINTASTSDIINNTNSNNIDNNTNNIDLSSYDNRILNLENKLQKTVNAIQKIINNPEVINNSSKNVDNTTEKKQNQSNNSSKYNPNLKNLITDKSDGKKVECWGKVVGGIKECGKVMLYSNLANSNAVELNDMTIGISFPEGLTPFGKSVIGKSENITEISKLISMEYGKPMQIKLIDNTNAKSNENSIDSIAKGLDLPLNIIE